MFEIYLENILPSFQTIASELKVDLQSPSEFSTVLEVNREKIKGEIRLLQIFNGVYVILFDINSKDKLELMFKTQKSPTISCLYHRSGIVSHKSDLNIAYSKIDTLQNIIIANNTEQEDYLTFEGGSQVRLSVIVMVEHLLTNTKNTENDAFKSYIYKLFDDLHRKQSYRHFGKNYIEVLEQLDFLFQNQGTDTMSLMMNKAATLMLLAKQFFFYEQYINNSEFHVPLKKTEIEKIIKIKDYIINNLGHQITLQKLSQISSLNPKKIRSGFRYLYNSTPLDYTTKLRIKKAIELLDTTDKNISEISYEIGISNRSYFSSLFYKSVGVLPKQYRSADSIKTSLYQLSYRSKAKPGINQTVIEEILNASYKNNGERDVTGCLIYNFKEFYQILEGAKSDVLFIYQKIKEDSRHNQIEILRQDLTTQRYFNDFSMANLNANGNSKIEELIRVYEYHSGDENKTAERNNVEFWEAIQKLLLSI